MLSEYPSDRPPRIALVGFGFMGHHHARAIKIITRVTGVPVELAIVESYPGRREAAAADAACTFGSVDELLATFVPDAAVLATPPAV